MIYIYIYNMEFEKKLFDIHNAIKFNNKNQLKQEIPEQLMVLKHIKSNDVVLEFGGSVGRNSCIISKILSDSKNFVTIEPSPTEQINLIKNRDLNNFNFQIEPCVLSDIPLYSKGWYTYKSQVPGSIKVNNIKWEEFKKKYNMNFTVFIIDNEGNFVDNLKTIPNILNGIRLLNIEHDFNSNEDLQFFNNKMKENGFIMIDKFMKNDKYGPGINWSDGIRTDPIFVSVWERKL
jgi:hypothetical protein